MIRYDRYRIQFNISYKTIIILMIRLMIRYDKYVRRVLNENYDSWELQPQGSLVRRMSRPFSGGCLTRNFYQMALDPLSTFRKQVGQLPWVVVKCIWWKQKIVYHWFRYNHHNKYHVDDSQKDVDGDVRWWWITTNDDSHRWFCLITKHDCKPSQRAESRAEK